MYSINSKIGKQVLAWALVFTLVLSVIPTAISDSSDDEWFWDIDYDVYDEDQDGADDTIEIGYDPDTTCECDIDIIVYIDIYDEDGYVDYIYEEYTINNGDGNWYTQDWTPDYDGIFDFYVEMYDEWNNLEDNWSVTDVELSAMTSSPPASDDTINVDNYVGADDEDGVNNDIFLLAHNEDEGIDEVEISVEYFNGLTWTYYANGTTNNDGDYIVYNASSGEYRWTASYNSTDLEEETVSYTEVDTVNNLSHQMSVEDWDDADDYDDFIGAIFEEGETKDDGYVEVYDEAGELYDSGNTDHDYYGYDIYLLDDVEKGNYTFDFYYEEDGELLQSGWLHSFGSTSTNYDEWFEDWGYETNDTNGDGVANSIITKYDPNTECNCTIDIEVDFSAYNNDTGDYDGGEYYNHEINGTEVDSFETNEWSPSKNGNYTFEFHLYDENWEYEDHFNFTVYLECDDDSNDSDCDNDEWFEDWDYETEDNDEDNLDDTIAISYNPDTDCDCEIEVDVEISVYENSTGDWVDHEYDYHIINGTEEEYFEQSWTSRETQSYDFYVYMYDDDWNWEDEFWVYNVYLYQTSGAGGPGDEDEWFDWIDAYTYDNDDDGYDDTAEIEYDPDTTCECDINITLVIDVYDNETGYWVNGTEEDYTIYSDDDDYWYQSWSPEYNGTFDFKIKLYDEDENLEDEEEYLGIELHARSSGSGGGDGDYDEWFYDWDYDVYPSDTIIIGYDPDTECDCNVTIYVYVDVYDNATGDYVDTIGDEHDINNGYSDWFEQEWTAYEDSSYDFGVYLYDEDWNEEDIFWFYDVYLESDGGGGNGTGDDNGVGHIGVIDDWDEDDYVNDYIGGVLENDEFKEDAYFEIYDEDWNLVDSGNPNYYGMLFVSSNLTEGWYTQDVYYEEDDAMLQTGSFYSYGDSTEFEVVNVDNLVVDDDEYAVYDDVGFIAHQGSMSEENGVEGVGIEISKYNHSTEEWEYHAYVETNETGEAWLYNETCGEYEWYASTDDEKGYYEVWAHCDDDGNGGGDEDYDERFSYWDYYGTHDENDEHQWNQLIIAYDPDTDCDCEMDVYVEAIIWDENGDYVDYSGENHTIYYDDSDWFEIGLEVDEPGKYLFTVDLYDDEWNKEDSFNFSLIMSDEWFIDQFSQDGDSVRINLNPQTNYDGEIGTEYYFDVLRFNESNDDWDYIDGDYTDAVITSSENEDINFEWTADEEGTYLFAVYMYDEHWNMEDMAEFETEIVLNHAPEIGELNTDRVYEGEMFNFEVDVFDADEDDLEYSWDMGYGNSIEDDSVRYGYPDDGIYTIVVSVSDGTVTTTKEFELIVENAPPTLQVSYDDFGQEGQTLSFNAQTFDVPEDTVKVTWTFPDGTQVEGNFAQYLFIDDGEFIIGVTAEDEDGGGVSEGLVVTIENVAPIFTEFQMPGSGQEGEVLDFKFGATDPGADTIIFNIDFGDGTAPLITQDGNVSHKFAEGDTFTLIICAKDEDGGENCRQQVLPVSILEQLEDEGLLPGFNLLLAISALGVVGMLRRRTH